jgi:RNA polymerase sigma factor (sigma-70 family)
VVGPRASLVEDRALLDAARAGDAAAFGEFYRRHVDLVVAYTARRRRDPEVVADLVADVFTLALSATHRGRIPSSNDAAGWLLTIARNRLVDSHRRGVSERATLARLQLERPQLDDDDLRRISELGSDAEHLNNLLERLPEQQRSAVCDRVLHEKDYGVIALETGSSTHTVRQRVSRALRTLRAAMEESHVFL